MSVPASIVFFTFRRAATTSILHFVKFVEGGERRRLEVFLEGCREEAPDPGSKRAFN